MHKRKNKGANETPKILLQGFLVLLQGLSVVSLEGNYARIGTTREGA